MILYLTIIGVAVVCIATVLTFVMETNFFLALSVAAGGAVAEIAISGLTAAVCRLLPKKTVNVNAKRFIVSAKEKKFYEKLKIRKWKEKIPEIGHFTGFRKNKIAEPKSIEYLDRFLLEICYGERGHFYSLFTSFLLLFLSPLHPLFLPVSVFVAIVAVALNIPSIMTLRYNSYKLRILRESLYKKQRRAAQTGRVSE